MLHICRSSMASGAATVADTAWVGKRPAVRRLGGMADVLAMAAELGFSSPEGGAVTRSSGKGDTDALVQALRDLTSVQRNLAQLQVELQGRQDDGSVAHLTHVSAMEQKTRALAKTSTTLKDVIQNKDRIIARLQQPYSLDCIPVETEYQRQFAELLVKAASDYVGLSAAVADIQWSQSFKEPPGIWGELLRPIPVALASCTRYYEALSAMREAVKELHRLRVQYPFAATPTKGGSAWASERGDSECVTPVSWTPEAYLPDQLNSDDPIIRTRRRMEQQLMSPTGEHEWSLLSDSQRAKLSVDVKHRRMSWPPAQMKGTES